MKSLRNILLPLLLTLLCACGQITDIGIETDQVQDPSEPRHVYFDYSKVSSGTDSLIFSFGLLFEDEQIISIPVGVTGITPVEDVPIKISIDSTSTAEENDTYKAFSDADLVVPAGTFIANIPLTVMRGTLPEAEDKSVKLTLYLEDGENTRADMTDRKKLTIYLTNYLQEPFVWNGYPYFAYLQAILGDYAPIKYRKLLEYYDQNTSYFDSYEGLFELFNNLPLHINNAYKVRDYFLANTQYGVTDLPEESTIGAIYKRPYTP